MNAQAPISVHALKIALPYLVLGAAWIILSDQIIARMADSVAALTTYQTYKGWFFVVMSSTLIFFLSRFYISRMLQAMDQLRERDHALVDSQQAYLGLMGSLPGMTYLATNHERSTMQFVSEGCSSLTGYDSTELSEAGAVGFGELILPDDRQMVHAQIRRALRDRLPFQMRYRIRTKDGTVKWVSEQGCGVFHKPGAHKALIGYIFESAEKCQFDSHDTDSHNNLSVAQAGREADPNQFMASYSRNS